MTSSPSAAEVAISSSSLASEVTTTVVGFHTVVTILVALPEAGLGANHTVLLPMG